MKVTAKAMACVRGQYGRPMAVIAIQIDDPRPLAGTHWYPLPGTWFATHKEVSLLDNLPSVPEGARGNYAFVEVEPGTTHQIIGPSELASQLEW